LLKHTRSIIKIDVQLTLSMVMTQLLTCTTLGTMMDHRLDIKELNNQMILKDKAMSIMLPILISMQRLAKWQFMLNRAQKTHMMAMILLSI